MKRVELGNGLVLQHGDDGHWLQFDGNASINLETKFRGCRIVGRVILGWARRVISQAPTPTPKADAYKVGKHIPDL